MTTRRLARTSARPDYIKMRVLITLPIWRQIVVSESRSLSQRKLSMIANGGTFDSDRVHGDDVDDYYNDYIDADYNECSRWCRRNSLPTR